MSGARGNISSDDLFRELLLGAGFLHAHRPDILMIKLLLSVASLLMISCNGQSDPLKARMEAMGWIEADPPKPGTGEWMKSNQGNAFIVRMEEDLLVRVPEDGELDPSEVVFEAGPIKYIGLNRGEFGGGLYINAVGQGEEPFFPGNIVALVPLGDDLYVIEGLAHMGTNGGSIHAIRNFKEPSAPERITLLPSAPEAVLVDTTNDKPIIVIVGHDSLMIFEPDKRLRVIHHDAFWGSLYPSSLVKYHEYYVFGIRGGVVATTARRFGPNVLRYFRPGK
jgi:hypothetical protein